MYGYALNSGNPVTVTAVFGAYAVSTAFAVGGVIALFYKASSVIASLNHHRLEPLIMRLSDSSSFSSPVMLCITPFMSLLIYCLFAQFLRSAEEK